MLTNPFARRGNAHSLAVAMTGVKMGDRLLQIGCGNGARLAAVAAKVGLSGRSVAVVPDETGASRVRKGAEAAGVLVEIEVAPPTRLPVDDGAFDVAMIDDTGAAGTALTGSLAAEDQNRVLGEVWRALRAGGRVILIGATPARGIRAMMSGSPEPAFVTSGRANAALVAQGFKAVRTLAEREGLVFIEGIKPR